MATKYFFDNKQVVLPGAYSTIKSAIDNPPVSANYGRILVIDNNTGATFGGGSGINGELASAVNSVYRFSSLAEYQSFLKPLMHLLGFKCKRGATNKEVTGKFKMQKTH